MDFALEQSFETAQGLVRYGIVGTGTPLVFVHGTPWSSQSYAKIITDLSRSFQVFFYDLIGYGQSEMRDGQLVSLDVQGRIFAQILEHWQLDQPSVVAHDFGGAIALRAHLLHRAKYHKLMLMNVVAMAPWGSSFFAHVRSHEAAFAGVPPYIHKAILKAYIDGAIYKSLSEADMTSLMSPWLSEDGQNAFYRQIAQANQTYTDEVQSLYDTIECPVRILWGENDEWIPIEMGRKLNKAIPNSEFFPVAKAGHLIQMDQPKIVREHILEFFL